LAWARCFLFFLVALPLAVMFSAALLTIALFAKSYKEAQSYISPLMIVVIVPAIAAMLPGVELTPRLSLVPILNVSLLCKDLIAGTYHWELHSADLSPPPACTGALPYLSQ